VELRDDVAKGIIRDLVEYGTALVQHHPHRVQVVGQLPVDGGVRPDLWRSRLVCHPRERLVALVAVQMTSDLLVGAVQLGIDVEVLVADWHRLKVVPAVQHIASHYRRSRPVAVGVHRLLDAVAEYVVRVCSTSIVTLPLLYHFFSWPGYYDLPAAGACQSTSGIGRH
jgi:hypothetical protein